ncbi:hypothetical protein ACLB2K_050246 [Fragaria x ananassa]
MSPSPNALGTLSLLDTISSQSSALLDDRPNPHSIIIIFKPTKSPITKLADQELEQAPPSLESHWILTLKSHRYQGPFNQPPLLP